MNVYENIVIFNSSLSEEDLAAATQKVVELISAQGGEVLKTDKWGLRKLSYAIGKQSRGNYVLFLFRSPSDLVKKLEDYYKVTDTVVKFMVVRLEKKQREAALRAISAAKAAREEAKAEAAPEAPPAPTAAEPADV